MSDEWPEGWVSGAEKMSSNARRGSDNKPRMTNDHGILYLVGEHTEGEWLFTEDTLPPHLENHR